MFIWYIVWGRGRATSTHTHTHTHIALHRRIECWKTCCFSCELIDDGIAYRLTRISSEEQRRRRRWQQRRMMTMTNSNRSGKRFSKFYSNYFRYAGWVLILWNHFWSIPNDKHISINRTENIFGVLISQEKILSIRFWWSDYSAVHSDKSISNAV